MDEINLEARHYEQAFKFYFDDYPKCIKKKYTKYGVQICYVLYEFQIFEKDLLFEELWFSFILDKTAYYFLQHEIRQFNSVDDFIMKSIRRSLKTYLIRRKNYEKRFDKECDLNKICDDRHCPPDGVFDHTSEGLKSLAYGGLHTDILRCLNLILTPIQIKVFELFFVQHLTDKQISEVIHLPVKKFKGVRQQIRHKIQSHRYDILTELGLTDEDLRRIGCV